ncbi:MAG: hypothetical protein Q8M24_21595 [Pseudolabrys sp.]|nr:hypothetical protein [Pseudolabrys sp.]MDP2298044.1 hypothetical protein [Pseudolabrys sp.]
MNSPSILSVIVGQATIILVACSVLLGLMRDLYEDKKPQTDTPNHKRTTIAPLLESQAAARLRWALRWFSTLLGMFYVFIAIGVVLVQVSGIGLNDGKAVFFQASFPVKKIDIAFNLQDIYEFSVTGHFIIVVTVSLIVACMVRVRHSEANSRWRNLMHDSST